MESTSPYEQQRIGACKTRENMKVIRNNRYTSEVKPEWDNIKTQC